MNSIDDFIRNNRSRFIEELTAFLRIPSVSAQSERKEDCVKAARFLENQLNGLGFEVSVRSTPGHPVVLGHYDAGNDKPTVLIYGHYDVQPVEPLDLWNSSPFEPSIIDGTIYARGASDDKGQVFAHVKAVEAHLMTHGTLPVNVIFLIEGEEETASENLDEFIQANKAELKSDVAIVSDSAQYGPGVPAICYGLRGICAQEIRVDGAKQDLHSGSFGGAVPNPCNTLCEIIARLKDGDGRILIPGFYDDVLPLEAWEREAFAKLPWDDERFRDELGAAGLHGEKDYSTVERKWGRPTLDINGIFGGYSGEGAKTIIPAWAGVKITMRLVPNQTPQKIRELFREYIQKIAPDYVKTTVIDQGGGGPVLVPRDAEFMPQAVEAMKRGFGKEPVFIREGGSIPVVSTFKQELGLNTLLMGFGQPDDNCHAPNEKFSLDDYIKGIQTSAQFLGLCG